MVDNASTDGTKEFLSTLGGDVQVINNSENFGFAKACNQGAEKAKGKFLVFLNNDTIPKSGWLSALMDEVTTHSDVSIVGSKLLYPDNTIQHAGVIIGLGGLAGHSHKYFKRDDPGYFNRLNIIQNLSAI